MSTGEVEGMVVTIPLGTPAPNVCPMTAGVVVLVAEPEGGVVEEAGAIAPLDEGVDEVTAVAELIMVVVTVDTTVVVIYVCSMYVVGPSLIITVFPMPYMLLICDADSKKVL